MQDKNKYYENQDCTITALSLRPILANFTEAELESAYRSYSRDESRVRERLAIVLFVLVTLVLAIHGVMTTRHGEILTTLMPRLLITAVAIAYLIVSNLVKQVNLGDLLTALTFTILAMLNLWIQSMRGPSYLGHAGLDVVIILSIYLVLPIPIAYQLTISILYTIGESLMLFTVRTEIDSLSLYVLTVGLVLANIVGFLFSNRMARVNRAIYLSYRNERELRTSLQNALDEVKALSSLLPICCVCRKVRDDSGYWSNVENYLRSHLNKNITHGLCPDCFSDQMREIDEFFSKG